ncbi:MAG: malonic semialdehyde reductase [Rickettsia endosymbiont of Labidopullus appendiculatus]|nr:malonic semialdehyde reductase [Rickettsia endosymbiont of Labidopullus appendiculatus]
MRNVKEVFSDRTCYKFLDKPVDKILLEEIYNIAKLGPTSANCCPLRIVFVQSQAEKDKLYKCLAPSNVEKVRSAPVTAIFAFDTKFYELIPRLFPHDIIVKDYFSSSEQIVLDVATRSSSLQAAYFMIVARSKGLACGPMSGFNKEAINSTFFNNTNHQVNFLCNIGYRDGDNPYPRLPRLDFNECCKII